MALGPRGLGRGLDALFQGERAVETAPGEVQHLPIGSLVPNPKQPRRHFAPEPLEELAASIRNQGLLQPILVRPMGEGTPQRYEIVAGERRWRAAQLAELADVPVLVRHFSDQETLAVALIENLQREDLNPLEEAMGLQQLKEEFGLSQEDLAQKLGKSRSTLANSLRLLQLAPAARKDLAEGRLSAGHARALLSLIDSTEQEALRKRILREGLSVREAEGLAAASKSEGEGATPKTEGRTATRRRPQSAVIVELQNRLSQNLGLPVKFSGRENKGRMSIAYASQQELEKLLGLLGLKEGA